MKSLRATVAGLAATIFVLLAAYAGADHPPAPTEPKPAPTFTGRMKAEGRVPWGEYDGHRDCWALIGDTSYITCRDGYKTTS
ncbi:hypothetical protein [Streptomyces sp. NPDC090021]|uniref:hypothetical protein n=1 Tax=Streptomyces sp. NPDC090021 TaxID=3365919 RepID=UPI00381AABA5